MFLFSYSEDYLFPDDYRLEGIVLLLCLDVVVNQKYLMKLPKYK